ncbi:MAG: hypothetical protein QOJ09_434, partial [Actinomycetota bacterium]|nr:hypothetical protein [Actinomycetota bacterium]
MAATVVLVPERLSVAPGTEGRVTVRVRNSGTVVDEFTLTVVGDAAGWSTVEPASLNLFPGAQGEAQLIVRPPRTSTVPAGPTPIAVMVRSREDPSFSTVEEGVVDVGAFNELGATLVPQTAESSGTARARVRLLNAGNVPVGVRLGVEDPNEALAASINPNTMQLAPGQGADAGIQLRPRNRFLRGPARPHSYSVVADYGEAQPLRAGGTLVQKPVIGAGWVKVAGLLAALAIGAVILKATTGGSSKP